MLKWHHLAKCWTVFPIGLFGVFLHIMTSNLSQSWKDIRIFEKKLKICIFFGKEPLKISGFEKWILPRQKVFVGVNGML